MIIPFVPKHEKDTNQNLKCYIQHMRENSVFFKGASPVSWQSDTWDLTQFYPTTGNVKTKARFIDIYGQGKEPFAQPFMDEAKALLADFLRQSTGKPVLELVTILRHIYVVLPNSKYGKTINELSDVELYSIENTLSTNSTQPFNYCRILERLSKNIIEPAKITKSRLSWLSGQKYRPSNRRDLVGERNRIGSSYRSELPDIRCILDLASVFHNSDCENDVVVSSWFALSMYAPSRINEILTLPVDCQRYDDSVSGSGHGIVWVPEKGGDPLVKRAASEESGQVASLAIQRLVALGKSARKAAKWYEINPTSLYLPTEYEYLRGKPVTRKEIQLIIGRTVTIRNDSLCTLGFVSTGRFTSSPLRKDDNEKGALYTFESLERYVLKKLPYGWPYADQKTKLKFSEALFTMPRCIMASSMATCLNIPQFITHHIISHELGRIGSNKSVFQRNNLLDPATNQPWKLRSHQPRHLLNTIAQSKHLSQELIAFWSGRKSVKQNECYDHTSQEFIIEAYLRLEDKAPKELIVTGPLKNKIDVREINEPISREAALKEELAAFQVTKYGYCRHDFSLTPCPKDRWCNNCGEAYFAKGDIRQIKMAKLEVKRFTKSLNVAKKAKNAGEFGVDQWIEKLEVELERATIKLAKLTDAEIQDGTIITLPPPEPSQTKAGLSMEIRRTNQAKKI